MKSKLECSNTCFYLVFDKEKESVEFVIWRDGTRSCTIYDDRQRTVLNWVQVDSRLVEVDSRLEAVYGE